MAWRTVQLGEVLRQKRDRVRIEPGKPYKQITVRLWGKGLALRGTSDGSEIAAESQVAVGRNDFLISKIDARHGAFGLVPADLEGAVVSNDFPCFTVRQDLLDSRFLEWFSKTETFVSKKLHFAIYIYVRFCFPPYGNRTSLHSPVHFRIY